MQTVYIILANCVLVIHIAYVAFVVLGLLATIAGALFGWKWVRNPWFRIAHLVAIGVVVAEIFVAMTCPLTTLENYFRALAGQQMLDGDFIAIMLEPIIFTGLPHDHWILKMLYFSFAAVVVLTFVFVPPRWQRAPGAGPLSWFGWKSSKQI